MSAFLGPISSALDVIAKGGPYVGPRGGKWSDPEHTHHWDGDHIDLLRLKVATGELGRDELQHAIAATAEREHAAREVAKMQAAVVSATTKIAESSGWKRHIPYGMNTGMKAPWAYERNGSIVSIIKRGGKWFVELAASDPHLVVSGAPATFLRSDSGGRAFSTMREAARKAARFMKDNGVPQ